MDWFTNLLTNITVAHSVLALSAAAVIGLALGRIKVFGLSLGIAGVLFAGLTLGHFGIELNHEVLDFIREFGLVLFVYTIGLQVGPGFFASLRAQGIKLNLLAGMTVLVGTGIAVSLHFFAGLEPALVAGLLSGSTTNTPSLGAAQEALKNFPALTPAVSNLPALGYAVAYPFGIIGTIISMAVVRAASRVQVSEEAATWEKDQRKNSQPVATLNLRVTNKNLEGLPLKDVPSLLDAGLVVSRILRDGVVDTVTPETKLRHNDTLYLVGSQEKLHALQIIAGEPASVDIRSVPSDVIWRNVVVTRTSVLGKTIAELHLSEKFETTITRIQRADVELHAAPHFTLQFGDIVRVVGEESAIVNTAKELGNSPQALNHADLIPFFLGILIGVIIGSIPFMVPGVPAPVKLGLAGGPLLVAIVLGRLGRVGPLNFYMPHPANLMLREVGIVLFLACVGLKAGGSFVKTLTEGDGLQWMMYGGLVTLVPLLLCGLVGRAWLKLNYLSLCGVLAGSMTDPPALAFANAQAPSAAPSISYATVYPLTMLLRVLLAQVIVLVLLKGVA